MMWKTTNAECGHVSEMSEMERSRYYWTAFKQGDQNAYAMLYNIHAALLLRYGRKIIHDREVVKDCLHDLFIELWRNRQTIGNPESVKNYLLKSLRTKLYKKLKGDKWVVSDEWEESDNRLHEISPEYAIIQSQWALEQKHSIDNALKKLSKRQREIIFLLFYEDMSPTEVATVMSLTIRTIYNTTYNAIQVLKKNISVVEVAYITILTLFI
ncbi:sigma-70 family RNA polymerase sigma factor [Cytophagaceae bacterium DM2B3-1]|uniref:Sigma-70 family RNA polymerase sigma factor n=1 Tax=Xanthocytophaga flava TaxID=3048013 RepID=A0ABT7CJK1_9BACT|nr:sigma-70 family RNA polymerase sigma factor [Xanthocytophaga flavus]MDJ1467857.1 sigma-70 family RNA polymerase sigma factor [Xanthocytophaga flavus]MDJ1493935.1 sigma-70 family RNA polymerase sigma factor [Xanthocytophaga flavus]